MNGWAAEGKYDCNFICICVLGDRSAVGLSKEMSNQMKLTHCVNAYVANPNDMPSYGQLGCQGFIILDKEHKVVAESTSPFMQVRNLAFDHVEALLEAVCADKPLPDLCPGESGVVIEVPEGAPAKLKGSRGMCVKLREKTVDFGFMDGPLRGKLMELPKHMVRRLVEDSDEEMEGGCSSGACNKGVDTSACSKTGSCQPGSCDKGSCAPGADCGNGGYKAVQDASAPQKVDKAMLEKSLDLVSVKVPSMDAEHAEIADAFRVLAQKMSADALEAVLKCMTEHFEHEEALFEEFEFGAHVNEKLSARKSHADDHKRILAQVHRKMVELQMAPSAVPASFVEQLLQDFHEHTTRYDVQYAEPLSQKGAK
mmetsp:Transcript_78673/g.138751  ORF Transcript_78673/g.138751 Transcript_78673/m.138751 type:complete len:368 (-) Transcript_78673:96-1199(-)